MVGSMGDRVGGSMAGTAWGAEWGDRMGAEWGDRVGGSMGGPRGGQHGRPRVGGADLPLRVHRLPGSQQQPRQGGEELQAHGWVPGWLEAAPEDGDQLGQGFSEGRA